MAKSIENIIQFFRKSAAGIIIAGILLTVSFLPQVSLWIAESLRILAGFVVGIVVHHLWHSKAIEDRRRDERIKVIEEYKGLQRLGLNRVLPERDSNEMGKKTFDFLERFEQFKPRGKLIIIGITVGYLPEHLSGQIKKILEKPSKMRLTVCVLDPDSPCATLRSQEVHHGNRDETREKIRRAIKGWKELKQQFPDQIILKKSEAIPYGEYEAIDTDKNRGVIYHTPVVYRVDTNFTPSFIFSPKSVLYEFHKEIIKKIINDAKDV